MNRRTLRHLIALAIIVQITSCHAWYPSMTFFYRWHGINAVTGEKVDGWAAERLKKGATYRMEQLETKPWEAEKWRIVPLRDAPKEVLHRTTGEKGENNVQP